MKPQRYLQARSSISLSCTRRVSRRFCHPYPDLRQARRVLTLTAAALASGLFHGTTYAQTLPPANPYIHQVPYPPSDNGQPAYPAQSPGYETPGYSQQDPYGQQAYPRQQGYPQQQSYAQQPYSQQQDYGNNAYAPPAENYPPGDYSQTQPAAQPLDAQQIEQLVAPIALYPDTLVAQILAAATYPAQVSAADQWRRSMGYAQPEQVVAGADAQTWDPSVKALTAFPQVLSMLDRNLQWTTELGNAYYNQPQDVLQTIQVMRQRAQSAGTLVSTPQEAVSEDQGYIELAPRNPQVVYVPTYDPWSAYGEPVQPYSGFSLAGVFGSIGSFVGSSFLNYGPGTLMSAFSQMPWGWLGWALNWLTQSVSYNHSAYYSHSTSVDHWGFSHHGPPFPERGWDERQGQRYNRFPNGGSWAGGNRWSRPMPIGREPDRFAGNRPFDGPRPGGNLPGRSYGGNPVRPALPGGRPYEPLPSRPMPEARSPREAFNHDPAPVRPGYGPGAGIRLGEGNGFRSGGGFSSPAPIYRAPSVPQRGFGEPSFGRGFAEPGRGFSNPGRSFSQPGRGFAEPKFKPERRGGFHLFGGGRGSDSAFGGKAPKMPKSFHQSMPKAPHFSEHGHGGGGHFGGGHSGGGHSGGGHSFGGHHH